MRKRKRSGFKGVVDPTKKLLSRKDVRKNVERVKGMRTVKVADESYLLIETIEHEWPNDVAHLKRTLLTRQLKLF